MTEATTAEHSAILMREALEGLVDALRTPDVDRLLACEAAIESAIRSLPPDAGDDVNAAVVRRAVAEARLALLRCRRLGASLVAEVRQSLGQSDVVYGAGLQPAPTGRFLNARG